MCTKRTLLKRPDPTIQWSCFRREATRYVNHVSPKTVRLIQAQYTELKIASSLFQGCLENLDLFSNGLLVASENRRRVHLLQRRTATLRRGGRSVGETP